MEACSHQPLATDSFSYSWLTNRTPSFAGLNESLTIRPSFDICDENIIKEFKQALHHHHQNNKMNHQDFDFNSILPESKASDSVIHAGDIFADGSIMPVYPNRHQLVIISAPATPMFSLASITERSRYCFLEKLKKSSKRVLKKSVSFLSKLGFSRDGVRVDDLDRKVKESGRHSNSNNLDRRAGRETRHKSKKANAYNYKMSLRNVRSCNNSPWASPPPSPPLLNHPSLPMDSSIDEAILHCKRSFASK